MKLRFCPHALEASRAPCGRSPAEEGQFWFRIIGAIDQTVLRQCGECHEDTLAELRRRKIIGNAA